jgi:hypothetical protein
MPSALRMLPSIIDIGTAGTGLIGNIMNAITRGKAIGNLQSAEKKYANLTPEQLAGLVSRAEQPLGQDLIEGVTNQVQADMATRGLSQAPGIFAATESQALAPYKLQEQQNALQLVMKQLGLPIEYADAILQATQGGGSDITSALMMMMLRNANSGGGGGGFTDVTPSYLDNTSPGFTGVANP